MLWGTNYLVTSEVIPQDVPLFAAAVRALPAGLLLLLVVALRDGVVAVPRGPWWWRAPLLGALNIAVFFVLFFVAAYRLPGGVAAVVGALGPFLVAGLSYPVLGERPGRRVLVAATIGIAGVALFVLSSATWLDPVGLAAAAGGTATISVATVLGRRWGLPPAPSPGRGVLALTSWQLVAGGLLLLPFALAFETLPAAPTGGQLLGLGYLALVGTCVAHFLWFQGVSGLPSTQVTLLSLLSPVVATIVGWAVLGQALSTGQFFGAIAVLGAIVLGSTTAPLRLQILGINGPWRGRGTPRSQIVLRRSIGSRQS
jgi:probable blue pigment (indigoidine) exporter